MHRKIQPWDSPRRCSNAISFEEIKSSDKNNYVHCINKLGFFLIKTKGMNSFITSFDES